MSTEKRTMLSRKLRKLLGWNEGSDPVLYKTPKRRVMVPKEHLEAKILENEGLRATIRELQAIVRKLENGS
jgi:hypothetical protein